MRNESTGLSPDTRVVALDEARSDAELLEAVRRGVIAAYGSLYERHAAAARNHAQRLSRCDADADDLVAESFARVLNALRTGRGPNHAFRAYLLTALRHVAYDRARREKYLDLVDNLRELPAGTMSVPFVDPTLIGEEREFVAKAMASLPERWREVLYHTEIEGLSPAAVAPRMKIENTNSVAALAYRARAGLRVAYLQAQTPDCARRACQDIRPKLAAWLRHRLSKRDRATVDAHLDRCRHCRQQVDNLADLNVNLPA
jgi:RNA polymerase sigma factor (sigma-70 family)